METNKTTPATQPQVRRRIRKPVSRETYFIDWSEHNSIWHLPDHWIAEALQMSETGVACARKREAPEELKTEPEDSVTWLQVANPREIIRLQAETKTLENKYLKAQSRIHELEWKRLSLKHWALGWGTVLVAAVAAFALLVRTAK